MFSNQKALLIITVSLFAATLLSSFVNIAFDVGNHKLESSIEQISEDKANLRAKYLSETALDKLSSRAEDMEMQQASSQNIETVSIKYEKIKRQKLITQAKIETTRKPRFVLTGY